MYGGILQCFPIAFHKYRDIELVIFFQVWEECSKSTIYNKKR